MLEDAVVIFVETGGLKHRPDEAMKFRCAPVFVTTWISPATERVGDSARRLITYETAILDGVAEQPDEFVTDFDDVMRENLDRVIATQDAVLLGRRPTTSGPSFGRRVASSRSPASLMASRNSW